MGVGVFVAAAAASRASAAVAVGCGVSVGVAVGTAVAVGCGVSVGVAIGVNSRVGVGVSTPSARTAPGAAIPSWLPRSRKPQRNAGIILRTAMRPSDLMPSHHEVQAAFIALARLLLAKGVRDLLP